LIVALFLKGKYMFLLNDQITDMLKKFQAGNEQFTNALKNMFSDSVQNAAGPQGAFSGNEQFSNAVKANIEVQVAFLNALTTSNLATAEKLLELNMSTAKATMEESIVIIKQLLTTRDAQEVQALLAALPQSISAKATAYSRHFANIGSVSQAEFARATEQQFANTGVKFSALMDQVSKNMPAGFENSAATAKAVITSASAGHEQFNKKAQQAAEAVGVQASKAADKVSQFAEQVPGTDTRAS
jgi:phasin family protein